LDGLKHKTIRGGAAKLFGQVASMALRLGTLMVLAPLLDPADFGIVAMVSVLTGIFDIFATGGLSMATVQSYEISHRDISSVILAQHCNWRCACVMLRRIAKHECCC